MAAIPRSRLPLPGGKGSSPPAQRSYRIFGNNFNFNFLSIGSVFSFCFYLSISQKQKRVESRESRVSFSLFDSQFYENRGSKVIRARRYVTIKQEKHTHASVQDSAHTAPSRGQKRPEPAREHAARSDRQRATKTPQRRRRATLRHRRAAICDLPSNSCSSSSSSSSSPHI